MFGQLNLYIGVALGAALIGGSAWAYNAFVDNPSIVRETTVKVEAQARERTLTAINEVTDEAQRARAMRRYCRDVGKLYNFATGQCR